MRHRTHTTFPLTVLLFAVGCAATPATKTSQIADEPRSLAPAARSPSAELLDEARDTAFNLAKACDLFFLNTGAYPTQAQGVDVLSKDTENNRAILEGTFLDPWHRPYVLRNPPIHGEHVDIISAGPDGVLDTADDIGNWLP